MGDVPLSVEERGLAEDDELGARLQHVLHPSDAVEPHQFYRTGFVGEDRREPLRPHLPDNAHVADSAAQQDITSVVHNVADVIDVRFVNVPVRKIIE